MKYVGVPSINYSICFNKFSPLELYEKILKYIPKVY